MKNYYKAPPRICQIIICAMFFGLVLTPNVLLAQFFTELQPNQITWPTGGYARYQYLQGSTFSKSVKIVSMLDVRNAQSNGILSFQLPGTSDILYAEATLISDDPTTGFIWSGKLTNAPGYVCIVYQNGKTAGFIQKGPDFYEISPIDNNHQFLVKRNTDYSAASDCGTAPPAPTPPEPSSCDYLPDDNSCPALITVLLILTPEAKIMVENMYGSVDLLALLGQASVNTAFWNSDIPNKEIRVKWVVKSGFNFFSGNNGTPITEDLKSLPAFSEPERTNNKADLVVFVPHVTYAIGAGAANIPQTPDPNQAFSIVLPEWFMSRLVFAHEVAHNFGCRHNWSYDIGNDDTDVCAHGKRYLPVNTTVFDWYQEIDSWITIMGRELDTGAVYEFTVDGEAVFLEFLSDYRILHYSNPLVSYFGEPTGRADDPVADNADQIRKVGCAVSNYNPAQELGVSITASPCSLPISLSATITTPDLGLPGVGPYSVYWFWNTTGIFNTGTPPQFLGTGTTLNLLEHPNCPYFWIKCVVVSSDNITVSRIKRVSIASCECLMNHRPGLAGEAVLSTSSQGRHSVFPNPVSQDILFVASVEDSSPEIDFYEVIDVFGNRILNGAAKYIDETQVGISIETLHNGLYFLVLRTLGGEPETHKFIVSKTN